MRNPSSPTIDAAPFPSHWLLCSTTRHASTSPCAAAGCLSGSVAVAADQPGPDKQSQGSHPRPPSARRLQRFSPHRRHVIADRRPSSCLCASCRFHQEARSDNTGGSLVSHARRRDAVTRHLCYQGLIRMQNFYVKTAAAVLDSRMKVKPARSSSGQRKVNKWVCLSGNLRSSSTPTPFSSPLPFRILYLTAIRKVSNRDRRDRRLSRRTQDMEELRQLREPPPIIGH